MPPSRGLKTERIIKKKKIQENEPEKTQPQSVGMRLLIPDRIRALRPAHLALDYTARESMSYTPSSQASKIEFQEI